MTRRLSTSESVAEGHPDKIADQISDAVLDALPVQDRDARVAVETLVTTGRVHITGEVSSRLRPGALVRDPDLLRPICSRTAAYGHFGRTGPEFTWEGTDRADELRQAAGV